MFLRPPPSPRPDIEARVIRRRAAPFAPFRRIPAAGHGDGHIVVTSPHSGRQYPARFLEQAALPLAELRRVEDAGVDCLLCHRPLPAPVLLAEFPRSFVDANRAEDEIDAAMFREMEDAGKNNTSRYLQWGLGVIPKTATGNRHIYQGKLPRSEAQERLTHYYRPFHRALGEMLGAARGAGGNALLLDCHSMPTDMPGVAAGIDIVIGDNHGRAAGREYTHAARAYFRQAGLRVALNAPFAGGYITCHYGRPQDGIAALQIEISRRLYLDEKNIRLAPDWEATAAMLCGFIIHMDGVMGAVASRHAADRHAAGRAAAE